MRAIAVGLVVAALAAALLFVGAGGGGGERVVAVTFPGLSDDVALLVEGCDGVVVEPVAPPGVDPHTYNLEPSKARLVRDAVLVVSTGHAPFEERIHDLVPPDRLVIVTEIPGIRLLEAPTGAVNLHAPIYDPGNYAVFARYLAERLAEVLPDCAPTIKANGERLAARAEALLGEYSGVLNGTPAVLSEPAAQYAVTWLGADTRIMLAVDHAAQVSPEAVEGARSLLARGAIAVILVDSTGAPVSKAGEWLAGEAHAAGAPLLPVEAPYEPGPIIEKIEEVAARAVALAARG